jgi:hypothetical protein
MIPCSANSTHAGCLRAPSEAVKALAPVYLALNLHHTQLIHWSPFSSAWNVPACGLPFHLTGLESFLEGLGRSSV